MRNAAQVGDTPIWGAGGYAEKGLGGAAATGYGEDLYRFLLCRSAVDLVRKGVTIDQAAEEVIQDMHHAVKGRGGIIMLSAQGIGISFNTPRMAFGFSSSKDHGEIHIGIDPLSL